MKKRIIRYVVLTLFIFHFSLLNAVTFDLNIIYFETITSIGLKIPLTIFHHSNKINSAFVEVPTVTTSIISDVKGTSARAGGSIINNGGSTIISEGLCWSTNPNPTISNYTTPSFADLMTGLTPNTIYYVRAYSTNIEGTGYGNQISFNSGYSIGSTFGGGMVFFNDGNGHGLICAHADLSTNAEWGCYGIVIGVTSTAIYAGAANTNAIMTGCGTANIVARLCNDLVTNNYDDWYLPSKDELNLMYGNLHTQKLGGFVCYYYWSSSEYNASYAWLQYFCNGKQCNDYKNYTYNVRPVRNF